MPFFFLGLIGGALGGYAVANGTERAGELVKWLAIGGACLVAYKIAVR
jgi:hypothetical protein